MKRSLLAIILGLILLSCDNKKGLPPVAAPSATQQSTANQCACWSYSACIQPILNANCVSCHTSATPGNFQNYNGTLQKVNDGTFKNRVLILKDMPQGPALSASDLQKIQCWLDNGAPNN